MLYVVSGIAGYFNTLGGIGSCNNVNEASVNDTFTDDEGAFFDAYVTRLYTVCLGRDPDITGMTDWVNALYYGQAGGGDVAYGFFFSDEYLAMNKSNYLYVQDLYRGMHRYTARKLTRPSYVVAARACYLYKKQSGGKKCLR